MNDSELTLFLCGDVMLGRGIDQIQPQASRPELFEPYVRSALDYVELAERVTGPLPRNVPPAYVWGDALDEWARVRPDARIINLETAVTTSDAAWPGKGIHYRMHPANVGVLTAAGIHCCVLANNHVLDWGRAGLGETLDTLHAAGFHTAGAGRTAQEAARPAILPVDERARVLVFAFATLDCGTRARLGRDRDPRRPRAAARAVGRRGRGDRRARASGQAAPAMSSSPQSTGAATGATGSRRRSARSLTR